MLGDLYVIIWRVTPSPPIYFVTLKMLHTILRTYILCFVVMEFRPHAHPDRGKSDDTPLLVRSDISTLTETYVRDQVQKQWRGLKYFNYTTYRRLQSFTSWPHGETSSPQELSASGFYNTGTFNLALHTQHTHTNTHTHFTIFCTIFNISLYPTSKWDLTRRYNFGCAFEHWEATSDAWKEHSYWFPYYVYRKYIKGDTFITETRILRSQQLNARDVVD
jgi:hypothetical protein